jgi:protein TonB
MGDFQVGTIVLSFEASSNGLFSVAARRQRRTATTCAISPSVALGWADSTETVVLKHVNPPTALDRIEYSGPDTSPDSDCSLHIDRTVTARESLYVLHFEELSTAITAREVKSLLEKIREVARVTQELSPRRQIALDSVPSSGGRATRIDDQPYFEFQVEKQAAPMPDNPRPPYPDMLRSADVEGEVLAQFIVDADGRVEMSSFKVLKSSHDLFTNAVRSVLPSYRFFPAEVGGRKVRQLIQMPFVFSLNKELNGNEPTSASSSNQKNYPPQLMEVFLPPLPVPTNLLGFHLVADFDIDERGKIISYTFTRTPNLDYNRKLNEVLRSARFRPGTTPDGIPIRMKAQVLFDFRR